MEKIKKICGWTCNECKSLITIKNNFLNCDKCGTKAKLEDLFEQDIENISFNKNY